MSNLYNRIEHLCNDKGVNITQMCKDAGVSRASLTDLKMDRKQGLSSSTLSRISNYFGVSVDYLLGAEAERPYSSMQDADTLQALKDEERALLHSFRTMTEEQKRMMAVFIKGLKSE